MDLGQIIVCIGLVIFVVAALIGIVQWADEAARKAKKKREELEAFRQAQLAKYKTWIDSCCNNYKAAHMICDSVPGGLDQDEEPIAVFPDINLMEYRAVRYSRGAYAGPTIRIAKGVSFRLAGSQGRSESVDELRVIDRGTLLLTSKRLAFLGAMRTNNVDLQDLISVEPYTDGVSVHRERKQKAENYAMTRQLVIEGGEGDGLIVNGSMMKTAIELAKCVREAGPENLAQLRRSKLKLAQA
jgi:hypothetical protein